jgi:NADH-ubiquinone oxidoreductase chain 1
MLSILYLILESIAVIVPILLVVAWVTILERKVLAATQRRVGPNSVGYYGILQPFSDALKLIIKETVVPGSANKVLFYLAPLIAIIVSLLGWAIIPLGQGLVISDFSMGVLYTLTLSSIGVYGILFAGWSANSKYAFLGSIRASATMISYELILSSSIIVIILLTGSFNYIKIIEAQQSIWFIVPLAPVFILFFIAILAETSRTPFDLQEAESELVAGFFTEHSSIIFVFYFLAEYSSIVLFSAVTSILFLGGYNFPELFINNTFLNIQSIILGLKTCLICFTFIWFRATFPRVRFDQIIVFCWTALLPVIMAFILLVPCILIAFDIIAV